MSLSRRQRNVPNAAAAAAALEQQQQQRQQHLASDNNVDPPAHDVIKLTSPPPTRPPTPVTRFRSNGPVPPSFLRQTWPCSSLTTLPPAGESGNSTAFFATSDHERAPVSADSISAADARKPRCGRWIRFKAIGSRVSLVIVVGALLFDVYLLKVAFSGARGKQPPNGGFSGEALPSRWAQGTRAGEGNGKKSHDGRDSPAETWPSRPELPQVSPDQRESSTWTGQLRSIWGRVTAIDDNDPPINEPGTSKAGAERDLLSHHAIPSKGGFLSRFSAASRKRKSTSNGQQPLGTERKVALHPTEMIPGLELGTTYVPRPLPQPRADPYDGQRVAVVVPYVGSELPVWWEAFAEQARFNDGLVDWLIFCDKKLVREDSPPNIKFFPMDTRRMAWLLAGVVEADVEGLRGGTIPFPAQGGHTDGGFEEQAAPSSEVDKAGFEPESHARVTIRTTLAKNLATRKRAASFLHQLLIMSPYYIVEFKPALGWLFREYLGEYTHWAYGDLDVLFGDMRNGWLEPEELKRFDIITFSFGDQYRAYLRGQLTIHKNVFKVNRVWRGCSHLISYSDRLEAFRANRSLPLESAEGCYSRAAALDKSLKIKFTVKALSDVDEEGELTSRRGREVIIDGHGLVTLCPDLGYYDEPAFAKSKYRAVSSGLKDGPSPSMQDAVGPITAVKKADTSQGRCEHWIKPEHQTCVENVGASHTLFLLGGEYYKQEFINTAAATGGRDCRAGAFYHFQAHKFNFRVWNSLPPVPRAHFGVAAGPGGIVPLPVAGWRESVSGSGIQPPVEHTQKVRDYCLAWRERRRSRPSGDNSPEQVCAAMVSGSEAVAIVDTRPISPTSGGAASAKNATAITLGSVGHPSHLPSFLSNAGEWEGPKIFAMALDADELESTRQMSILNRVKYIRGGVLIVALVRPPPNVDMPKLSAVFPEKALMNLVSDLCESRYLLALPGLSRLSPNAFQAVSTQLHHRPTSTLSSKRTEKKRTRPKVPGPVTLVIPFDKPTPQGYDGGVGVGPSSSALAASTAAAAAAAVSAHKAAALVLERAWLTLAASKAAEAAAESAMNAATKTAEAVASAKRDGRPPLRSHDDAVIGGVGGGGRGRGGSRPERSKPGEKENAAELMPLQISFGTAATAAATVTHSHTEVPRPRKKFLTRDSAGEISERADTSSQGDIFSRQQPQQQQQRGTLASSSSWEAGTESVSSQIKASRRLDALANADSERVSRGGGAGRRGAGWGSIEAIEWDMDGIEVIEWLRELLLWGPGMPGLVIDLWSPGALFLRRVEEFGGAGCMDAAYALGLWRAGSSFQVVEGATLTPMDPTVSSQRDVYRGAKADSDGGRVFHVPGGECLLKDAVAKTASIYATFLGQVANVYRHPRSEIAGQNPRRTYADHWDYLVEASEATSAKPWAGNDASAKSVPSSSITPPAAGYSDDDARGKWPDGGGGGGSGLRGSGAAGQP